MIGIEEIREAAREVDSQRTIFQYPMDKIIDVNLTNGELEFNGTLCTATAQINNETEWADIQLTVKFKKSLYLLGVIIFILLSGFLWSNNVTIQGDSNPIFIKRIAAFVFGLTVFICLPSLWFKRDKKMFHENARRVLKKLTIN